MRNIEEQFHYSSLLQKGIYVKPKHFEKFTASRNPSKVPDSVKLPGVQVVKFEFDDKKENLKVHIFSGLDSIPIFFSLQEHHESLTFSKMSENPNLILQWVSVFLKSVLMLLEGPIYLQNCGMEYILIS